LRIFTSSTNFNGKSTPDKQKKKVNAPSRSPKSQSGRFCGSCGKGEVPTRLGFPLRASTGISISRRSNAKKKKRKKKTSISYRNVLAKVLKAKDVVFDREGLGGNFRESLKVEFLRLEEIPQKEHNVAHVSKEDQH
jgi:hypothetical protein